MKQLNKKIIGNNKLKSIIFSIIISILYVSASIIAELWEDKTIICCIFFGIITIFFIYSSNFVNIITRFIITIFTNIISIFLVSYLGVFGKIFFNVYKDRPSAGTGLWLLMHYETNFAVFILVFIILVIFNYIYENNKMN